MTFSKLLAFGLATVFFATALAANEGVKVKSDPDKYSTREADWRNGAVVYQVIVDRFAPSANLEQKRHLYPAPKILKDWSETPSFSDYLPDVGVWQQEVEFWGGDFDSVVGKLDYIKALGVEVLYLNPIHLGYTNHKYDALDYKAISPEYGEKQDLQYLINATHHEDMKIVLDGVFNHMGRNAPIFQQALKDPNSEYRDWFYFGEQYPYGYRAWAGVENLPEINLENPDVRGHIYRDRNSVVRSYLYDGIDGWRLDVAFDIGPQFLQELTDTAHKTRPQSLVVGEIWNYPNGWFPVLDGVMNFHVRHILLETLKGNIAPQHAQQMIARAYAHNYDHLLKSWTLLDNHDTPRLTHLLRESWQQRMAQVLQFTLPGSPNIYYGNELGMDGGNDPENRAPMRWDKVSDENQQLSWVKGLIAMHKQHRALKVGDFRTLTTDKLLGFQRYTNNIADAVFVFANPTDNRVEEWVQLPDSSLMNNEKFNDLLGEFDEPLYIRAGMVHVSLAPGEFRVVKPHVDGWKGYTPYKRVK